MSYFFGLGNGKVGNREKKRINKILESHQADFVTYEEPNGELRYWFECENKGSPFDEWTATVVMNAIGKVKTGD